MLNRSQKPTLKNTAVLYALLMCFGAAPAALAQRWIYHSTATGLAGSSINALLIDQNEELWAATNNGVGKFNGAWTNYQAGGGLAGNNVIALAQDRDGHLWFGTRDGVSRIELGGDLKDPRAWRTYNRENTRGGLASDSIRAIVVDHQGSVWFGTEKRGLSVAHPNAGNSEEDPLLDPQNWENFNRSNVPLGSDEIHDLEADGAGNVWVITDNSIDVYQSQLKTWLKFELHPTNANRSGTVLFRDRDNYMWIGTQAFGVYRARPNNLTSYDQRLTTPFPLSENSISAITQDRHGLIWLGHLGSGITLLDPAKDLSDPFDQSSRENITVSEGLSNNQISALAVDAEDNIWIGHRDLRSLTQLDNTWQRAQILALNNELRYVEGLFRDRRNFLWAATHGGAARIDANQSLLLVNSPSQNELEFGKNLFTMAKGLSGDRVFNVFEDSRQFLWFGTNAGASRVAADSLEHSIAWKSFDTRHGLAARLVRWITQDRLGYLWFAASNAGVNRVHVDSVAARENWLTLTSANGLASNQVAMILPDSRGRLWFATENGASLLDPALDPRKPESWQNFGVNEGLAHRDVQAVFEDFDGNIWFATEGGACRADANLNNWTCYTTQDGLASNFVTSIAQLKPGEYWFGTGAGASKFAPNDPLKPWTTFLLTSILSSTFITALYADTARDAIWFGTDGGGGARYQAHGRPPQTFLLNRYDAVTGNPVTFNFSGADAITPARELRYQFRLDHQAWSETNNTLAQVFIESRGHKPQRHTFQVRALDAEGNVDPSPASDVFYVIDASQGAVIASDDGLVQLYIPPNSASPDSAITITAVPAYEIGDSLLIAAYDFSAYDLKLTKPATLTMKAANPHGFSKNEIAIFRLADSHWQHLGGTVLALGDSVQASAPISARGRYALRRGRAQQNAQPDALANVEIQPRVFSPAGGGQGHGVRAHLSFSLRNHAAVNISVYDLNGRLKRKLAAGVAALAGLNSFYWDGRDDQGKICVSGLYLVAIEAEAQIQTKTVMVANTYQ